VILKPARQAKKRIVREMRLTGRQYVKLRKRWRREQRAKETPQHG